MWLGDAVRNRDAQAAVVAGGCCLYASLGLVNASEDAEGFIQKNLACPGQARAACRALEQLHGKMLLLTPTEN